LSLDGVWILMPQLIYHIYFIINLHSWSYGSWIFNFQLPMQSVPIANNFVSSYQYNKPSIKNIWINSWEPTTDLD
jgi:hypothetical protein